MGNQLPKLFPPKKQQQVEEKKVGNCVWISYYGEKEESKMSNYQQWDVQQLTISSLGRKRILTELLPIRLFNLKMLSLRNHNIESIQCVTMLFVPNLERLFLCGNRINCVKEINKTRWKLKHLDLEKNEIKDLSIFSYFFSFDAEINTLKIQSDANKSSSLAFILKMNPIRIKTLDISGTLVCEQKVMSCIKKKYPTVKLSNQFRRYYGGFR